jgi:hypothetical protein
MKMRLSWTLCLISLFMAGIAGAEPYQTHVWELGAEVYYYRYEEPDVMKDTGPMYGIAGSYAYHRNWMLKLEGRGSWGKADYSSQDAGTADRIDYWVLEARALAGYDFSPSASVTVTPFIGVGYRYLYDEFGGHTTTTGSAGYDRESNYLYSPVGVMSAFDLGRGWSWGATAEYDIFWRGRQVSHLSGGNLVNQQDKGYGARGSFFIQKKLQTYSAVFEPFIRYWNIDQSEVSTRGYEPKNNTTEVGARMGVRF